MSVSKSKRKAKAKPKLVDEQWVSTERSERAEDVVLREYHYHMLRAEELREFLYGCGVDPVGHHGEHF